MGIAPCMATDPGAQYERERRIAAAQARRWEYPCRLCGKIFGQEMPVHGDENKVCFRCRFKEQSVRGASSPIYADSAAMSREKGNAINEVPCLSNRIRADPQNPKTV